MADMVETMAYSGLTPWHGLGHRIDGVATPDEMLELAGLNWEVEKRPLFIQSTDEDGEVVSHQVPGQFALTRNTDNKVLTIVGDKYIPVQNKTALDFFKKFTEAGHMEMETAGSLRGGQMVWALSKVKHTFDVCPGDPVENYLLFSQPHLFGKGLNIKHTSIRVVCNNTLTAALRAGGGFRMPHMREFTDEVAAEAEATLGLTLEMAHTFEEEARFLASKRVSTEVAKEFMTRVFDPKAYEDAQKIAELASNDNSGEDDNVVIFEKRVIAKAMTAIECQPGADLVSSKGTAWGMFNAVTYLVDHHLGRTQDGRVFNALFGNNAALKSTAKELALEYAKAA